MNDAARSLEERIRAIEVLTDVFDGLSVHEARGAIDVGPPEWAARALWSLARHSRDGDAIRITIATLVPRDAERLADDLARVLRPARRTAPA